MARKSSRTENTEVKPPSDAYTGLLALSLIAMIVSCVVLYLDYAQYGNTKAPAPAVPPVARPAATTSIATPNTLAAIPSEPLPAPVMPSIILPTKAEEPNTGPVLLPPE